MKTFKTFVTESASAGLTSKEKSTVENKAHKGEHVDHGHFNSVEKAIEKKGYSKEAAQKIAAAAMWKNIKR